MAFIEIGIAATWKDLAITQAMPRCQSSISAVDGTGHLKKPAFVSKQRLFFLTTGEFMGTTAYEVGKKYFIRTVTYHAVGLLTHIHDDGLVLSDAAWVADSGRFHNALKDGTLSEVEPFVDPVIINPACVVDATEWRHALPVSQK